MTGSEVLADVRKLGVDLTYKGANLRVTAPKGVVTADLREALATCKEEIVEVLRAEYYSQDPRPDLAADSVAWDRLLAIAWLVDGDDPYGLAGALHGLRCCGAHLRVGPGGVVLEAGELGEEFGELRRKYLAPHAVALHSLLAALAWQAAPLHLHWRRPVGAQNTNPSCRRVF